jgi:hypothetical protein
MAKAFNGKIYKITLDLLKNRSIRTVFFILLLVILIGTIFYTVVEGWSIFDSLYFTIITLTTVGFGDLVPSSTFSKMFTMFYVLVGVGLMIGFFTVIAEYIIRKEK